MNKLSIIILTDRTDERFTRALDSALFADEVVVVLNRGARLAISPPDHVKTVHMPGEIEDFSAARNQAIEQARSNWIFFLDSDEVLPPESAEVISQFITQKKAAGARIARRDVFYGQPLKWGEAGSLRLVRLGKAQSLSFVRPVHEVAEIKGNIAQLPLTIDHYAHNSISEFWQAITNYSRLEAASRYRQGKRFSVWQLCLYPPAKFIFNYVFKLGFLDGWRGLVYAGLMSCHSLMVRIFLYETAHR